MVMIMYMVFNEQGVLIAQTTDEQEADFLSWVENGYYYWVMR